MDQHNYLVTFFGIILSFAVAKSLENLAYPLKNDIKGDVYWPHTLASGLIILLTAQAWWGLRLGTEVEHWTFSFYILSLSTAALYYFMAEVISPKSHETDIKAVYWQRIRAAMVIAAASMASNMIIYIIVDTSSFELKRQVVRLIAISIALGMAYSRRVWVHYIGYGLFYVTFISFVAISN